MKLNPQRMPVFFIFHGSPMFALEPRQLGKRLNALGQQLENILPRCISCNIRRPVNPGWPTR